MACTRCCCIGCVSTRFISAVAVVQFTFALNQRRQVIKTCCESSSPRCCWRLNEYHNEITANQITILLHINFWLHFSSAPKILFIESCSFNCKYFSVENEVKTTKRCPEKGTFNYRHKQLVFVLKEFSGALIGFIFRVLFLFSYLVFGSSKSDAQVATKDLRIT